MFTRLFAIAAVAALAIAGPAPLAMRSQCNTGPVTCCDKVQSVQEANPLLGLLGLADVAAAVGANVGLNCNPITVIGTGSGAQCQQQPVCCEQNDYNGLVNLGCSPVNLSA
ncbi:hydrophobin [Chiua virens]|nr:hydrophobin [Chiua virens]